MNGKLDLHQNNNLLNYSFLISMFDSAINWFTLLRSYITEILST